MFCASHTCVLGLYDTQSAKNGTEPYTKAALIVQSKTLKRVVCTLGPFPREVGSRVFRLGEFRMVVLIGGVTPTTPLNGVLR